MVKLLGIKCILLSIIALYLPNVHSFSTPRQNFFGTGFGISHGLSIGEGSSSHVLKSSVDRQPLLYMSSSEDGEIPAPRKRRRRKDGKNTASGSSSAKATEPEPAPEVEVKVEMEVEAPKIETPAASKDVQVKVLDIRDVVAGKVSTPEIMEDTKSDEDYYEEDDDDDDEELEDDEEYEYYYEDENNNEVIVGTSSSGGDSSLESLLADARRMRQSESEASEVGEEESTSIKATIKSVLSTIVTADFFVVCALLAWFLAGIFCSYVLKDDTVQIAFNMQFERVVQPALGILMIGSAAGAAFEEKEEEY